MTSRGSSARQAAFRTFTVVLVLGQFGVQTTSLIAVLGAAGLAIGLALQGTLSNVAAGVMLLLLRPFRVGQFVQAGGISGTVRENISYGRPTATDEEIVAAAKAAFPAFARTSREERVALLRRILSAYKARYDEIARTLSKEMGAPRALATKAQAATGTAHLEKMIEAAYGYRRSAEDPRKVWYPG